jgi:DNA-binding response OmpR family regulator
MNRTSKDIAHLVGASAPRVLIVEDEADLALLISYSLEAEGYVVESVARGDEAELRLAENAPDLVILDWMLPGLSGIEICRRLRAREATRTLPVIMVTARREEADRVRGLAIGADDYVVKPFSVPELVARVRALLRRSRPERIAERLYAGDLISTGSRGSCGAATASFTSGRPTSSCWNICSNGRAACSRALSCSTLCGGGRRRSTNGRSTFTSGACARGCRRVARPYPDGSRRGLHVRRKLRHELKRRDRSIHLFARCRYRQCYVEQRMAHRAGSADLPLHGGRVPLWLADRMTRLGAVIAQAIVHHYGRDEFLRRLANPFWFQSFGAVMGMDWDAHSIPSDRRRES